MSGPAVATGPGAADGVERLSPWWWLGLPIALAVGLALAPHLDLDFYKTWIASEKTGLLELSHVLLPLAGLLLAVRILVGAELRGRPWLLAWVGLAALACLYIAGEEASWGQHYFRWATPDSWGRLNDQNETNLHNTSAWLDQKPRTLFEIGVVVGGILIPIAMLFRPSIRRWPGAVILPPLICLPTALLAELSRLSERLADIVEGNAALIFERASEVQETYFYIFIVLYLIVLGRRLRAGPSDPRPAEAGR